MNNLSVHITLLPLILFSSLFCSCSNIPGKWPEWLINGTPRTSHRYTFTTHRFYKLNDPLVESGLMGPVSVEQTVK